MIPLKFETLVINHPKHREVFCEKVVFNNFIKLTGEHLCWSLLFNKVAALRSATFLKRRLQHRFFSCGFCKIFTMSRVYNWLLRTDYFII